MQTATDRRFLSPAQRLIVAADFKPDPATGRAGVKAKVLSLAESLKGTGVLIKVNSILRASDYDLIDMIHALGLGVFADLKLVDIKETLETDGELLREAKPELLTAMCIAYDPALTALKNAVPETEVLGVTVLTGLTDENAKEMFSCDVRSAAIRFAKIAKRAGLGGIICSAKEAELLRGVVENNMTINTPAIRPTWSIVENDDQNLKRVMTPGDAICAGADRIVVGRPIVRAAIPYDAAKRTIDEIESALEAWT